MTADPAGVGRLRQGCAAALVARARARVHRRALDDRLAAGANPWSTPELHLRACVLTSGEERRRIGAALEGLVGLAGRRRPISPYLSIRHGVVLEHRDELVALAARLHAQEPVDVAVVAQLARLVWRDRSPVYVGGVDSRLLGTALERCEAALDDGGAWDGAAAP